MITPKYIGWKGLDGVAHICSVEDYEFQVIGSFRKDIYPPATWDSLFNINSKITGDSNYAEAKNIIKSANISLAGKKTGHPLLLSKRIADSLNARYKEQLSKIRVLYMYEELYENPGIANKYVAMLHQA